MNNAGKTYWRSQDDRIGALQEAAAREFPVGMAEELPETDRRRFLQVMGAATALAGAGCRWEKEKIVPFSRRVPDTMVPGVPKKYAGVFEHCGVGQGLLVASFDGRPIKAEGNPQFPESLGASSVFAQATLLEMYDPDRMPGIAAKAGEELQSATWEQFAARLAPTLKTVRQKVGAGLRILSEAVSSPTVARLREQLLQTMPDAQWVEYEPLDRGNAAQGAALAFGKAVRTHYKLTDADAILAVDADFLGGDWPAGLRLTREFSARRTAGDGEKTAMNRLYAAETRFSVTGGNADHRLPIRPSQGVAVLLAVEAAVAKALGKLPSDIPFQPTDMSGSFLGGGYAAKFVDAVAEDLVAKPGRSAVLVGPAQPPEAHAVAQRINALLGNFGKTVVHTEDPSFGNAGPGALKKLVEEMAAGKVSALVILGGNPAYNAPVDVPFAKALANVATSVRVSLYADETAKLCSWRIPAAHGFEQWADARGWDGTTALGQPLIDAPLRADAKSPIDVLRWLLDQETSLEQQYAEIRRTHKFPLAAKPAPNSAQQEVAWRTIVEQGIVPNSAFAPVAPKFMAFAATAPTASRAAQAEGFEVQFVGDYKTHDGRFANSAWLQELPDPVTKMSWDNAAYLSPADAAELGVRFNNHHTNMLSVELGGRTLEIPAYPMPGHARGAATLVLGYGRVAAGYVGGSTEASVEVVGSDAYKLRTAAAPWHAAGAKVAATTAKYLLCCTQDHFLIDAIGKQERDGIDGKSGRVAEIVRETTAADAGHAGFKLPLGHGLPILNNQSAFKGDDHQYLGARWGMAIDLSKCVGCNACTIACQAENNIPTVGKTQVLNNREMHWIRLDRYFQGDVEHPETIRAVAQPMGCQQCENAPCEQVCPVAATVHSHEGLNDMVYNRCVGTRYCSNNCPYKVRRFNFFNYHKQLDKPENELRKLGFNPEVTVRHRGVMEKCTYCVQRIQNAKIGAKRDGRAVRDGEIVTACQEACPAAAIVFGDLADKGSAVSKLHASSRAYTVLEELNNKPRTKYLALVRNPHPKLAEAKGPDGHHA